MRNAARQTTDGLGLRRQLTLLFELLAHEPLVAAPSEKPPDARREQLRQQRIEHAVVGARFEHTRGK